MTPGLNGLARSSKVSQAVLCHQVFQGWGCEEGKSRQVIKRRGLGQVDRSKHRQGHLGNYVIRVQFERFMKHKGRETMVFRENMMIAKA